MSNHSFNKIESNIIASRSNTEENLRKQLAYLYHIFDFYGWCDLIVTHLSVRVANENALLILPFGLSFSEITPYNLVKVDFEANIIESSHGFQINKNGTTAHCAIYKNKPNINCILHTHSQYGVAVSNLEEDLLLLDQIAMMFHNNIGYHDFSTLFINDSLQYKLSEDLNKNHCAILKNHGLISVGNSIAEAFWFHYYLESTCKIHVLTRSMGSKIKFPQKQIVADTAAKYEYWRNNNSHIAVSDSELLFDAAKRKIGYIFDN